MSEELGIYGAFGDSSAIDGDIFLMLSGAGIMDYLRKEFLARAAFADYEHR